MKLRLTQLILIWSDHAIRPDDLPKDHEKSESGKLKTAIRPVPASLCFGVVDDRLSKRCDFGAALPYVDGVGLPQPFAVDPVVCCEGILNPVKLQVSARTLIFRRD